MARVSNCNGCGGWHAQHWTPVQDSEERSTLTNKKPLFCPRKCKKTWVKSSKNIFVRRVSWKIWKLIIWKVCCCTECKLKFLSVCHMINTCSTLKSTHCLMMKRNENRRAIGRDTLLPAEKVIGDSSSKHTFPRVRQMKGEEAKTGERQWCKGSRSMHRLATRINGSGSESGFVFFQFWRHRTVFKHRDKFQLHGEYVRFPYWPTHNERKNYIENNE